MHSCASHCAVSNQFVRKPRRRHAWIGSGGADGRSGAVRAPEHALTVARHARRADRDVGRGGRHADGASRRYARGGARQRRAWRRRGRGARVCGARRNKERGGGPRGRARAEQPARAEEAAQRKSCKVCTCLALCVQHVLPYGTMRFRSQYEREVHVRFAQCPPLQSSSMCAVQPGTASMRPACRLRRAPSCAALTAVEPPSPASTASCAPRTATARPPPQAPRPAVAPQHPEARQRAVCLAI